jgi:hypothetical protein
MVGPAATQRSPGKNTSFCWIQLWISGFGNSADDDDDDEPMPEHEMYLLISNHKNTWSY